MLRLLTSIAVAIILLLSCNPVKQATKLTNKALSKDSATVAAITAKLWPCVTVKSDTAYNYYDTTLMVDCPPLPQPVVDYFTVHDTAFFNNVVIRKVPVKIQVPGLQITKTIEDGRKIFVLQKAWQSELQKSSLLSQKLDKYKGLGYSLLHLLKFWQVWLVVCGLLAYWQRHKIVMLLRGFLV